MIPEQGSRKKALSWEGLLFVGAAAVVLSNAALVGAQDAAKFPDRCAETTEPVKKLQATDEEASVSTAAVDDVGIPAKRTKHTRNRAGKVSSSANDHPARAPSSKADGTRVDSGAYHRGKCDPVPVLGQLTMGGPATSLAPPTDDEIMFAYMGRQRSSAGANERRRKIVRITTEKIDEYVSPLRFYPLIGLAELHHAIYKCTVCFTERAGNGSPSKADGQPGFELFYIDHNHFHQPDNPGAEAGP